MKILRTPTDLPPGPRRVCVAIGVFDGVHLGHQQVIRQTVADAEQHEALSVVVTFDRHPNSIVAPQRVPPPVYSLAQKLRAIETLGVDAAWVIHFDEAFSRQTGEEFVRALVRDFSQLRSICVGSGFTFGHRRSGDVELLRRLGAELNFSVHGLAAVSLDGEPVSSTRIREAIRAGQFDAAGQMLGRAWSLAGPVVKGDQLGGKLGFPTANLEVNGRALPPNGVYAVHVRIDSQIHRGVLNIGLRPTVSNGTPELRVEAHLFDFTGDLYGRDLEITFLEKLREEQKFPSLEALKEQISRDVANARRRFT
jgi:riboflavin kinase / FMN adenylyltransferase